MSNPDEPTREQLTRRLERERKARQQAESVAEEATTRLYMASEELRSLNHALRDFVAIAAHDLRAPLATMSGFASLLKERWDEFDESERRQHIEAIERSANSMVLLAEDLLTVSRIETGALDTHKQVIELDATIRAAMRNFLSNSLEIKVQVVQDARIEADPTHIERILINYLGNAIKYGGPPIVVRAKHTDGWIEIRVCDHGEGVPEEFVPRLFGRFARSEEATRSATPGTGLGLSIVRGLAEANGGEAWYEPNEPRGSCFAVRLPASA